MTSKTKRKVRKNLILEVFEYIHNEEDGMVFSQMQKDLNLTDEEFQIVQEIPNHDDFLYKVHLPVVGARWFLSAEARFRLLEHEELKHSIEASKRATTLAWVAIFIAFGSFIVTAVAIWHGLQVPQEVVVINSEIPFTEDHKEEFEEVNGKINDLFKSLNSMDNKLDNLIQVSYSTS